MQIPKATWVRLPDETESHAVSAVVFGKLWIAYCRKQWGEQLTAACTDKLSRCDTCQRRVIEAARINVGLEELERGAVLWESEMPEW